MVSAPLYWASPLGAVVGHIGDRRPSVKESPLTCTLASHTPRLLCPKAKMVFGSEEFSLVIKENKEAITEAIVDAMHGLRSPFPGSSAQALQTPYVEQSQNREPIAH